MWVLVLDHPACFLAHTKYTCKIQSACLSWGWQASLWNMSPPYFVADWTEQLRDLASHKDASQTLRFLIRSSVQACKSWWLQTHCCFHCSASRCSTAFVFPTHAGTRCLSNFRIYTPRHLVIANSVQEQRTRSEMQIYFGWTETLMSRAGRKLRRQTLLTVPALTQ